MSSTKRAVAALAMLIGLISRGEGAANANAKEHGVMCAFLNMAEAGGQISKPETEARTYLDQILELNMSVSDKDWTAEFDTEKPGDEGRTFPTAYKDNDAKKHWEQQWQAWYDAKKRAKAKHVGTTKNQDYKPITEETQKRAARGVIQQLAARASALAAKYATLAGEAGDFGEAAANIDLKTAITGESTGTKPAVPATIAAANPYSAACTAQSAAKSLLATFSCVCHSTDAGSNDECVTGAVSQQWSGALNLDTALSNLKASCTATKIKHTTPEAITSLLANFRAACTTGSGAGQLKVRFGTSASAPTCDGANTKMCINIDELFTTAGDGGWHKIAWYAKLESAAEKLKTAQESARRAAAIVDTLVAIAQETVDTYKAAAQSRLPHVLPPPSADTITASAPIKTNTNKNANCEDNEEPNCTGFCEWNKTEKACKLTDKAQKEAEQANQETGGKEGKNKEGKTCADFKTEAECNAADGPKPTGKSKFCGWIGEDASGGDKGFKCRSSSFLLNKQFALSVVSAAFVALLF
uniref:Variant surface glycoprotein 1125.136 n=1 Tax=Trypanosoma brucei TaxID=5691 RepID=A0A1J0R5A6_9TRYP|nr:variant surface glycoprotein 1125.136 [Trypanosoma brucei]